MGRETICIDPPFAAYVPVWQYSGIPALGVGFMAQVPTNKRIVGGVSKVCPDKQNCPKNQTLLLNFCGGDLWTVRTLDGFAMVVLAGLGCHAVSECLRPNWNT